MLAGNTVELVAVRSDLFRQPDYTFAAGDDLHEPSALAKRLPPQVVPVEIEQIEGEEQDFARIAEAWFPTERALQCAEIGSPFLVKHGRLAVEDHGTHTRADAPRPRPRRSGASSHSRRA